MNTFHSMFLEIIDFTAVVTQGFKEIKQISSGVVNRHGTKIQFLAWEDLKSLVSSAHTQIVLHLLRLSHCFLKYLMLTSGKDSNWFRLRFHLGDSASCLPCLKLVVNITTKKLGFFQLMAFQTRVSDETLVCITTSSHQCSWFFVVLFFVVLFPRTTEDTDIILTREVFISPGEPHLRYFQADGSLGRMG